MERTLEVFTASLNNGEVKKHFQLGYIYGAKRIVSEKIRFASLMFSHPMFFTQKQFSFSIQKSWKGEVEKKVVTVENTFHLFKIYSGLLSELRDGNASSSVWFDEVVKPE